MVARARLNLSRVRQDKVPPLEIIATPPTTWLHYPQSNQLCWPICRPCYVIHGVSLLSGHALWHCCSWVKTNISYIMNIATLVLSEFFLSVCVFKTSSKTIYTLDIEFLHSFIITTKWSIISIILNLSVKFHKTMWPN